MVSICNLPSEILFTIFRNLSTCLPSPRVTPLTRRDDEPWIDLPRYTADSGLLGACLVNQRFRSIATPILYNHVIIAGFDLRYATHHIFHSTINAHALTPLMMPNHSARAYIRHLSIRAAPVDIGWIPSVNYLNVKSRALLVFFLWLLDEDQLSSIEMGYSGVLPGCPKFNGLRSLEHTHKRTKTRSVSRRWGRIETNSSPTLNTLSFGQLNLLERLKIRGEVDHGWWKLVRATKKLKSLSLRLNTPGRYNAVDLAPLPAPKEPGELLQLEYLDMQTRTDTYWGIGFPYGLNQFTEVNFLRSLSIRNCFDAGEVLHAAAPNLTNLRSLMVSESCSIELFNQVLHSLPGTLQTLVYENIRLKIDGETRIQRNAIIKHGKTLRKLSIYISQRRTRDSDCPAELPSGNIPSDSANISSAEHDDGFSVMDLLAFSSLEEISLPICHRDVLMLAQLPKLRAISITTHYAPLPCGILDCTTSSISNLWILLQSWANSVDQLLQSPDYDRHFATICQHEDIRDTHAIMPEPIKEPLNLKAFSHIGFLKAYEDALDTEPENEYYILRDYADENGDVSSRVHYAKIHEFGRQYPDIMIFEPFA
ncbi:hypothetical protein TWF225_005423 [Orbilia oligospora]|nr:hypothetical protein TWF751_006429 [Orbilia oligospora]KAF3194804.1 hypothetical protein TWF225_005423 [Orbilia oligospora]KAF3257400.1 hypothetical protein TWF128_004962 [Orbilia oligospora]KAF3270744.1 hypothetical protein TWF217_007021 [Orbilia oligospora]KAF3295314.1 hypothetical protein TWF132_002009 [Orbilia oligospora]